MTPRKAMSAVLDFIEATLARKRAQKQEQKMERQERERDESWGLDKNRLEGDEEGNAEGENEEMR